MYALLYFLIHSLMPLSLPIAHMATLATPKVSHDNGEGTTLDKGFRSFRQHKTMLTANTKQCYPGQSASNRFYWSFMMHHCTPFSFYWVQM